MQMLMNVRVMLLTTAMRMHSALTPRGVSPAPAILVTVEMGSTVQVSYYCREEIAKSLFHSLCMVYIHVCLFICLVLQISMSVNWRYIHAIPMQTALTQWAALTAHVGKALKEMGSTVQVPILHKPHRA